MGTKTALILGIVSVAMTAGCNLLLGYEPPRSEGAPADAGLEPEAGRDAVASEAGGDAGEARCWGDTPGCLLPRQVAAGESFTCVIAKPTTLVNAADAGEVWCWGSNASGQIGCDSDSCGRTIVTPQRVGSFRAKQIAAGANHACVIDQDDLVRCWGGNGLHQLGQPTGGFSAAPLVVMAGSAELRAAELALGDYHSCAITQDRQAVWCWGRNSEGQLGQGFSNDTDPPGSAQFLKQELEDMSFLLLSASVSHTCVVAEEGQAQQVYCWGANGQGQLNGVGPTSGSAWPMPVLAGTFSSLATSKSFSCAASTEGQLSCWGTGALLRAGEVSNEITPPNPVAELPAVAAVFAGRSHGWLLYADGRLAGWGENYFGQLGHAWPPLAVELIETDSPGSGADPVQQLSASNWTSCLVTAQGRLWCMGSNAYGGLAYPPELQRSPAQVVGVNADSSTVVAAGGFHTCAQAPDGLSCWGSNGFGELGIEISDPARTGLPVYVSEAGTTLAAGTFHTCVAQGGIARCWGRNSWSQLGGQFVGTHTIEPQETLFGGEVTQLSLGSGHSCADVVENSGGHQVYCWGDNSSGQLGCPPDPIELDPPACPRQDSQPRTIGEVSNKPILLASGDHFSCGIWESLGVRCWGANSSGQVAPEDFSGELHASLYQILDQGAQLLSATALCAGAAHACAVGGDGLVYCWGSNQSDQLGREAQETHNPAQQVSGLGSTVDLACGNYHTCAVSEQGQVYCWGTTTVGSLGLGDLISATEPQPVTLPGPAEHLAAGWGHTCALVNVNNEGTHELYCWGSSLFGEVGNGQISQSLQPIEIISTGAVLR